MIAACPKCAARYRVDVSRIGPNGARLKCAKCQALFRVVAPAAPMPEPSDRSGGPSAQVQEPVSSLGEPPVPRPKSPTPISEPTIPSTGLATPVTQSPGGPVSQAQLQAPPAVPQAVRDSAAESIAPSAESVHMGHDRLVVVADPDVDGGKATVSRLSAWGLQPVLVHDGVEAMLTIQRMLPRVVVLDAALPKMYGFQVCEVIKRNESLKHTGVILVGAVHNQDRYRRQPVELYGADFYIEQPDLPEGLGPLLQRMGVELSMPAVNAAPTPEQASEPVPVRPAPRLSEPLPIPPKVEPEVEPARIAPQVTPPVELPPSSEPDDALANERANAERLARIIVSDIVLYQPEKFAEVVAGGNVAMIMGTQIEEARVLFAQRVDERVREERDFIVEELQRVARERGL